MMLHQQVSAEVIGRVTPHAVNVIGSVLSVVEFYERDGALDPEVMRLCDRSTTCPGEVQFVDATGSFDAIHLGADQTRAGALDELCQEVVKVSA
jgi:hypothetical protein